MTDEEAAALVLDFENETRELLLRWRAKNPMEEDHFLAITGPAMLNVVSEINRAYGVSWDQVQRCFLRNLEIQRQFEEK